MRFGTKVWVTRGSPGRKSGASGCLRQVRGTLIGARGHQRTVRLDEDDPWDTVGWRAAGDVGSWLDSQISDVRDGEVL